MESYIFKKFFGGDRLFGMWERVFKGFVSLFRGFLDIFIIEDGGVKIIRLFMCIVFCGC